MTYYQIYRNWIVFYLASNTIMATVGSFLDLRGPITQVYLVGLLLFDLGFVIYGIHFRKLSFKPIELLLIALLLFSFFKMTVFNPFTFSRRIFTDLSNPLLFILKIALLRRCLHEEQNLNAVLKRFSRYLFIASAVTIVTFFIYSRIRSIYVGMTPPIEIPFAFNLLGGSYLKAFSSFVIILFSGKRSFLLASLIVFIAYSFFIHKKYWAAKFTGLAVIVLLFMTLVPVLINSEFAAIQKYVFTFTTLLESDIELGSEEYFDIVDRVSGGRFSEISYSLQSFKQFDFVFGKGPGYTYRLEHEASDFVDAEYSNVHFTPINLFSKYGIIFTGSLFFYLLQPLFRRNGIDKRRTLFKMLFSMYLIEMLFAFNIFVEPLIPFCLGYLTYKPLPKIYGKENS